jgi:uncharacterized protein (TIGR03067 family)
MSKIAVATCFAFIWVATTAAAAEERTRPNQSKSDKELLQGTWKAVSCGLNGKSVDAAFIKEHPATFTFRGDDFSTVEATTQERPTRTNGTFTVDATKSPKQMAMKATSGPLTGRTLIFIFELEGDTLKVGLPAKPGWAGPPEKFDQEGVATMVLERVKE